MKNLKKFVKVLFAMIIAITLGGHAQPVEAADLASIEIWEGYGGGGNSGSIFKNDYVVLKNKTDKQQSLDGLYLHQGSLNNWANKYPLEGKIEPNGYFLIKGAAGNGGERELPVDENLELDKLNLGGKSFRVAITTDENKPDGNNTIDTLVTEGRNLNNYESYLKYADNNSNIVDHSANPDKVLAYIKSQPVGPVDPDAETLNVYFTLNGGKLPSAYDQYTPDHTGDIEIPFEAGAYHTIPVPTRDGYVFSGYDTDEGNIEDEDGNVQDYTFIPESGKKYKFNPDEDSIILTAQWDKVKDATVTIDPNGGQVLDFYRTKTVAPGQTYTLQPSNVYNLNRNGYRFVGFDVEGTLLDDKGNELKEILHLYNKKVTPVGDVVLKARWEEFNQGKFTLNVKFQKEDGFNPSTYSFKLVDLNDGKEYPLVETNTNGDFSPKTFANANLKDGRYKLVINNLRENEVVESITKGTAFANSDSKSTLVYDENEQAYILDIDFNEEKYVSDSLVPKAWYELELVLQEKAKVNVTYKSNKKVTDLVLPESQEVEAGSTIKLPEIAPVMKAGVALDKFEYYLVNGEQKQPGDEIVVNEDTEIVAFYQFYNYRYTANIYLADENGMPGTKLTDASGFVVKANDVESVQSKNYPANLNVGPLLPGTYNITAVVPEGYELVDILDNNNNPVTSETRPVGAESTTNSRVLKVVVREKAPEVQKPQGLYIYELYGGGGEHGTYYKNDYIVLQNKSDSPIDLNGKYLHLTDQWSNAFVNKVALEGTIPAGGYYVLQGGTFSFETTSLGKELPQVNQVIGDIIPERDFAVAITMTEEAPVAPYSYDDPNLIDFVGTTRKNKMYMGQPASSPRDTWSARRVAYTGNNGTDFTFAFKANPNSKVDHEKYAKGEEDHREPLWYLNETNEEKVTVTFAHASDAEDFALENNEVPAEQKVWSETTIKLPAVKEEEKYNFLGWDVDGDGTADKQAGEDFEVTSDVTITGIWEAKVEKATVTYLFNKVIDGVAIPGSQEVEVGSTITLPAIKPEVSGQYSFLGWAIGNNKYATPKLKPGDEVTVTEDMTIMAIWEGAYGKVTLTFHENEFIDDKYENRAKINKIEDLEGFGFTVTNQQSEKVTAGKKSSSKGQVSISNGLVKGTYTLDVTVPEGYEIVRIVRNVGDKNSNIVIENGGTISLPRPEVPFNLTMVDSIYVEVRKVQPEVQKATVTFKFNKTVNGVELPDSITVPVDTEIELPNIENKYVGDLSFIGWKVNEDSIPRADHNPGEKITVTKDMTVTGMWDYNNGRVDAIFHEGTYTGTYPKNQLNMTRVENLDGFSMNVVHSELDKTTQAAPISTKGTLEASKLEPGHYTLNVSVPEGYEIVRIVRAKAADNYDLSGVETVENGSTFSFPPKETPFNMSMVESFYVEVKKVEKPATKTVSFVVDGAKGTPAGTTQVEVIEGEDALTKAPAVEGIDGYTFKEWQVSEDGLTYAAVFEDPAPQGPTLNENLKFTLDGIVGDEMTIISGQKIDKVIVKTRGGEEVEATIVNVDQEVYTISLARPLASGERVTVEIVVGNEISKAVRTRV